MFHKNQLNVGNMKTLMNVKDNAENSPLYLAYVDKILRDMAKERRGRPGIDYACFKQRLECAGFTKEQLSKCPIDTVMFSTDSPLQYLYRSDCSF